MSACIVGDLAEMGSEIYEWFCAIQRIHAHKKYIFATCLGVSILIK